MGNIINEFLLEGYREDTPHTKQGEETGLFKISLGQIRIHFMYFQDSIVVLHCFVKKQNKTPKNELKTIKQRKKEVETQW